MASSNARRQQSPYNSWFDDMLCATCCVRPFTNLSLPANEETTSLNREEMGASSRAFAKCVQASMMAAKAVKTHQVVARVLCPIFQSPDRREVMIIEYSEEKGEWAGRCNFVGGHVDSGENFMEATARHISKKVGLDKDLVSRQSRLSGIVHVADFFGAQVLLFVVSVELDASVSSCWEFATEQGTVKFVDVEKVSSYNVFDDVVPFLEKCVSPPQLVWTATSTFDSDGTMLTLSFYDGLQSFSDDTRSHTNGTCKGTKATLLRAATGVLSDVPKNGGAEKQSLWNKLRQKVAASTWAVAAVERSFVSLHTWVLVFNSRNRERLLLVRDVFSRYHFLSHSLSRQDDIVASTLLHLAEAAGLHEEMLNSRTRLAGVMHESVDLFGAKSLCFVMVTELDGSLEQSWTCAYKDCIVEFVDTSTIRENGVGDGVFCILQQCSSQFDSEAWVATSNWTADRKLSSLCFG